MGGQPPMDGRQRMCNHSDEGPALGRVLPLIARLSLQEYASRRDELHSPSNAGAQGQLHRPFRWACRLLDDESMDFWQQQDSVVRGRMPAQMVVEFQKAASKWETHHSNVGRVRDLLNEQLLQREPTAASLTPVIDCS